jgi:uncharacterized membrane protein
VQPRPKRSELDHLAKFYSLDERGIDAMFGIADARPSRAEGLVFLSHCLRIAGVLSLAAGVVFFVAANWSEIAVFGRFALLELLLVACLATAFVKPPPSFVGRGALFLAFVATGALLALFGQTYQTGADVYELFLSWALLGLLLVVAAQWAVSSAAWVIVFNTALSLYCGWHPTSGFLWVVFGNSRISPADIITCAAGINLLLWFAAEWRKPVAVPDWVRRLLVSCAFGFATWAAVMAIFGDHLQSAAPTFVLAPLSYVVMFGAVIAYAWFRGRDIYPLAVAMGSFIIVSLFWIGERAERADEGLFLLLALYLIVTSTAGGKLLMALQRRWRAEVRT